MFDSCRTNLVLATDSYKLTHWRQYPQDTEMVYSYMEARAGARYPETVFFGLQYILERFMAGCVVTTADVDEAAELAAVHFGDPDMFNRAGWDHIVRDHAGTLPLRIKAVPEGTVMPVGNVLMTVENTCPECFWLTNAMESMLTHVWYPTTVASLSRDTLKRIGTALQGTSGSTDGLPFMLHDFGYRGASTHESAAIGGAAHLICARGTDTLSAMMLARKYYGADLQDLAFSVPATEHSVMTSLGEEGEREILARLLDQYPKGILSIVGDSYNIYRFVDLMGTEFREQVLARDGKVVVRPDSTTPQHTSPEAEMGWIMERLWHHFGGTVNGNAYKVLDPHVGVLWGDGIGPDGIERILNELVIRSFSVESCVFGMGGGLLQKVNRDTERFAFKASAMQRSGVWHDVSKTPLDASKASKAGRLALVQDASGTFSTVRAPADDDMLQLVFENGELMAHTTFAEIRERAALNVAVAA